MRKILSNILFCFGVVIPLMTSAAEKLHIINSLSATGTFNSIMTAYVEDLSSAYDVSYVQGSSCQKAKSIVDNLVKNNQSVMLIWQGLITAEFLDKNDNSCVVIPTMSNFVRADLKYSLLYGLKGNVTADDVLDQKQKKVGYNGQSARRWLEQFSQHHNLNWKLIQYKNSTEGYLGVLNKEVDLAYANSAATFWKNTDKLIGLYSLNPNGDNLIPALKSVSDFGLADAAQADFILYYGPDLNKFKSNIRKIHSDNNSNIVRFYMSGGSSYTDTLTLPNQSAIRAVGSAIAAWQKSNAN
jgi:hypothetical protein